MALSSDSEILQSFKMHCFNYKLTIFIIQVLHCPESHTADYIKELIDAAHSNWNLSPDKQVAITTDNASNNVKMCADAGRYVMNSDSLLIYDLQFSLSC